MSAIPAAGPTETPPRHGRTPAVLIPVLGAAAALAAMVWSARPWQRTVDGGDLAALLLLTGFGLLPYVLAVVLLQLLRKRSWLWWSLLVYAVIITVAGIAMDVAILTDDSSTAALGFVTLPVFQLLGLPLPLLVGGIGQLVTSRRSVTARSAATPDR